MSNINSSKKRINKIFVVSLVSVVVFVFLVLGAVDGISRIKMKNVISGREAIVATIGDYKFSVSDLELFCAVVVDGDSYEQIKKEARDDDDLNTMVKSKALLYMRQYASLCQAAEKAGVTLTSTETFQLTENSKVDSEGKSLEGEALEEYYRKNHGVSYARYMEIKLGFALGEKYLKEKASQITYSEDQKKQIFNDNIEKMAWAVCDVIYIPLTSKDDGVNQLKINTAEKIAKDLNNCNDTELNVLWSNSYAAYNESGFSNTKEKTIIYGSICEEFPELFKSVCDENINGFNAIVSGDAVFVVRVNERHLYDYFRDSDAFSDIVFETSCETVLKKILKDSKYEPITTNAYLKYEFKFLK